MYRPHDETNLPRDHPHHGRKFYAIEPNDDGTVDVYLRPSVTTYETDTGIREHDISVLVVRGVLPFEGLEEDIRARYQAWCEMAQEINL